MVHALIVEGVGQPFREVEVEIDSPREHEVLIDVKATGLCHSDLTTATVDMGLPFPILLGHEVSGIVREVGSAVTDLSPGDHVVACLQAFCGKCAHCQAGEVTLCTNRFYVSRGREDTPRVTHDGTPVFVMLDIGGFAEQLLVHEGSVVKVDAKIPHDVASLLACGVITGAGAVINTAQTGVDDTVAIFGAGGVGLAAIQAAKVVGARRIIAVDLVAEKLELAKKLGATDVVNGREVDPVEAIRELTGGGVTKAFDFVGGAITFTQGYASVAPGGAFYITGMAKPGTSVELDISGMFLGAQRRIVPVLMGSSNFKRDIPRYANLYAQGRFQLDELVSNRISLPEVNEAFAAIGQYAGRAVVVFD